MIGNDIIDLKVAGESDPLRPRFLDKVFSEGEQEIILKSQNPVQQAWLLWAMKESAYKANQRRFGLPRNFNPLVPQCRVFSQTATSASGEVQIGANNYKVSGQCSINYIHCSATALPEYFKIEWQIIPASVDFKQRFLFRVSQSLGVDLKSIKIEKDWNSIPVITLNNRPVPLPFSLSHHGVFGAFSLALMNY